jgi:hypothetical protein
MDQQKREMSEEGAMNTLGVFKEVTTRVIQWPKREAMTLSYCNAEGIAANAQAEGTG